MSIPRRIGLIAAALAIGYLSAVTLLRPQDTTSAEGPPRTYRIVLTARGFEPEALTIRAGDTIRFSSAGTLAFWPASNPHPSHSLFSAFDPRRPIPGSGSWEFTFTKAGTWGYHDHLAPAYTGVITVTGDTASAERGVCEGGSAHTIKCWRPTLLSITEQKGAKAALATLADLFETEPGFSHECHTLAHDIGVASWQQYLANPSSILTPSAAACGNGFYHGFMEAFLTSTRDPERAKAFCSYLGKKIGSEAPDAELQCYHGIGHGAMDFAIGSVLLSQATSTLTAQTLVEPALSMCTSVSGTEEQLYRCNSAVFNALSNMYVSTTTRRQFNLALNRQDPLWICRQYPNAEESCNGNMNTLLYNLGGRNFRNATRYVEDIEDDVLAARAMLYLGALSANGESRADPEAAIDTCNAVQSRLSIPCVQGLAHGFMENGTPGKEGTEALSFCALSPLSLPQRTSCYEYVLSTLTGWFSPEDSRRLCASAPETYRKFCPANIRS